MSAVSPNMRCVHLNSALNEAARKISATFYKCGQYDHPKDGDERGGSHCQGLSALFLRCCKDGNSIDETIRKLYLGLDWNGTEHLSYSSEESKLVSSADTWGNSTLAVDSIFSKEFSAYNMQLVESKQFSLIWVQSSAGTYCGHKFGHYMVATTGHQMAASVTPSHRRFFDPNCGIVDMPLTTSASDQMKDLFTNYFDHPAVRAEYGHGKIDVEYYE